MSELINIVRSPETLQAFQLVSPEDMVAALKYIVNGGYTGSVNAFLDSGAVTWRLSIQNPVTSGSQAASIGDWLVIENSSIARVVPAALFNAQYTSA